MSKLEEMLKYVSEHNEFYKNRIKEYGIKDPLDINQWPILTRKELQENRYNMFSDGYKSKYFDQQLHRQTSSGTSGTPINVYWDAKDYYLSNRSLWRRRFQYYKILPNDKRIMFTLRVYEKNTKDSIPFYRNEWNNLLVINTSFLNEELQDDLVKIINDFEPKWLYITPYTLNNLMDIYEKLSILPPKSLKYIESVGELLSNRLRKRAESFFGVPVANMYGSEEVNGIAYECPYGNMHIVSDNVYLEYIRDENKFDESEGEALVTCVTNKAMPLIRYNQSDIIRIDSQAIKCDCGCNSPIVRVIKGRVREQILIDDNNGHQLYINPYLLNEMMEEANNTLGDKIIWFNYVYFKSDRTLRCLVALPDKQWFPSVSKAIVSAFNLRIGYRTAKLRFEVVCVDEPTFVSGKKSILHIVQ